MVNDQLLFHGLRHRFARGPRFFIRAIANAEIARSYFTGYCDGGPKRNLYFGWSDVTTRGSTFVTYHQDVLAFDAYATKDIRLFKSTGVEHCFGRPAASWVNFQDDKDC